MQAFWKVFPVFFSTALTIITNKIIYSIMIKNLRASENSSNGTPEKYRLSRTLVTP